MNTIITHSFETMDSLNDFVAHYSIRQNIISISIISHNTASPISGASHDKTEFVLFYWGNE